MHRIRVVASDGEGRSRNGAAAAATHVGKRWSSSLKEQLTWSSAAPDAEPAGLLQRWSCRLDSGQAVEQFCERMTSMCSEQIVQVPESTVMRAQHASWTHQTHGRLPLNNASSLTFMGRADSCGVTL